LTKRDSIFSEYKTKNFFGYSILTDPISFFRIDDSIEKDSGTGTDRNSLASEDFSDLDTLETIKPKKSKKRKHSYEEERRPKKRKLT